MFRLITRVQIAYFGLFVVACAGVFAYQALYVWPVQRCLADGGLWSAKYHECATPMPIWRITGRPLGSPPVTPAGAAAKHP
jgi:hypothetical protein